MEDVMVSKGKKQNKNTGDQKARMRARREAG